jgi:hypothetical protein
MVPDPLRRAAARRPLTATAELACHRARASATSSRPGDLHADWQPPVPPRPPREVVRRAGERRRRPVPGRTDTTENCLRVCQNVNIPASHWSSGASASSAIERTGRLGGDASVSPGRGQGSGVTSCTERWMSLCCADSICSSSSNSARARGRRAHLACMALGRGAERVCRWSPLKSMALRTPGLCLLALFRGDLLPRFVQGDHTARSSSTVWLRDTVLR